MSTTSLSNSEFRISKSESETSIVVIGAGISGLACANRLSAAGKRVVVIDSAKAVGGVIQSEWRNGYLLEHGPATLITKPPVTQLIDELGLRKAAEFQLMSRHRRFVWRKGRLRLVPTNPMQFLRTSVLSLREKFELLAGIVARVRPPSGDVTVGSYARERLGNGAVDALLKPAFAGVYAVDADCVSLQMTVPQLFPLLTQCERFSEIPRRIKEQRPANSPPKTPPSIVSFPDGLSTLTRALQQRIEQQGGQILLGAGVQELRRSADQDSWELTLTSGQVISAETVIMSQSASSAASLLASHAGELAASLNKVEHAPITIVHIGADESDFTEKRRAFGFLTVRDQGVRMLGSIWNERVFAGRTPAGKRMLTCFFGGDIDPDGAALSEEELRGQSVADLRRVMGFQGTGFDLFNVTRWRQALPIFRVGHKQRMNDGLRGIPQGIELLGSYLGGVSIPDRIERGCEVAQRVISHAYHERTLTAV
jgi:oxygen-dependent protoporphyrinogen oxidase